MDGVEPVSEAKQEEEGLKEEIEKERREFVREMKKETGKEIEEILERGPKDIEELVYLVNRLSFKEVHNLEIVQKYGKGLIGKIRTFLAGESDFSIDKDDQIRRNAWNALAEGGRKVLMTIFNRRVVAATGMAALLGILTGGVGWAAGGVIFGSMAGRATAEAISAITGKERGAREEILKAEKARWYELKKLAEELSKTEDVQKKSELMTQITDLYYRQGENVVLKQLCLAQEKFENERVALNKLRSRLQLLGEVVGLGAGVAQGFLTGRFAAIDIDLWRKIPGQSIMHEVAKVGNTWHFVWNEAGKYGTHLLGEPAWKIGVATVVERGIPVLLSAWSAFVFGRRYEERGRKAEREYLTEKAKLEREKVIGTIPKPPSKDEIKRKYQDYIIKQGWGKIPEEGEENWFLLQEIEGKKIPKGRVRIKEVDWEKGWIYFEAKKKYPDGKIGWTPENMPLVEFLKTYLYLEEEAEPSTEPSQIEAEKPKEPEKEGKEEIEAEKREKSEKEEIEPIEKERDVLQKNLSGREIKVKFTRRKSGEVVPGRYKYENKEYPIALTNRTPVFERAKKESQFEETLIVERVDLVVPPKGKGKSYILIKAHVKG